jgi:hypothetical protein
MSFLQNLKFINDSDNELSPILKRRSRLIGNLRDQLSLFDNPLLYKTKMKWVETADGKKLIEKHVPVRAWWRETISGQLSFFIKCGLKKVEFEKGKSAIHVSKKEDLPALIKDLIEATQKGELDNFIKEKDERQKIPTLRKKVA